MRSNGSKGRYRAPSATPWDGTPLGGLGAAEKLVADCHRDIYRYRHAPTSLEGEAEFFNAYERDSCPRCGSRRIKGNGSDAKGVRRWVCVGCGRSFTPATGTVFDGRKIPVADWTEFVIEALSFESVSSMTRGNRRSDTTLPYWMAKLFAVLEGVQDGVVLSGRVQMDEMLYPLALSDQPRMPDGSKMRGGYSKSKICIGVGGVGVPPGRPGQDRRGEDHGGLRRLHRARINARPRQGERSQQARSRACPGKPGL